MTQSTNFLHRKTFRRYESLWILLLFLLLTIIASWNVVTNLNGVIVGDDNDVYINPWVDWWTYKAITDPDISLWQSDMMYYPIGADLTFHSFSHLNTAVSFHSTPVTISKFYSEYLVNVPQDIVIAILPTGQQQDKQYMYCQTIHKHPMTGA